MPTNLVIPAVGKSISKVTLLRWTRNNGEFVNEGDAVAELETSKAVIELIAVASGLLQTGKPAGRAVFVGEIIGQIEKSTLFEQMQALKNDASQTTTTFNSADHLKDAAAMLQSQLPRTGGRVSILFGLLVFAVFALQIVDDLVHRKSVAVAHLATAAFAGTHLISSGVRVRRLSRSIRWILDDRCAKCGYDLRASIERCPECGSLMDLRPTHLHGKYVSFYHDRRYPRRIETPVSDTPSTPN